MLSLFKKKKLKATISGHSSTPYATDTDKPVSLLESIMGGMKGRLGFKFDVKDPIGNLGRLSESKAKKAATPTETAQPKKEKVGRERRAGGRPTKSLLGRKR